MPYIGKKPADAALTADDITDGIISANKIASKSPLTLKIGKEAFYKQLEMPLSDAYEYTSKVMIQNMQARDAEEGISAFIEKRLPIWTGK